MKNKSLENYEHSDNKRKNNRPVMQNHNYPENCWTEEDIEKLKLTYVYGRTASCPAPNCGGEVKIEKEEGEQHLKKKYVDTHFFLRYECEKCGRRDVRIYRKSP